MTHSVLQPGARVGPYEVVEYIGHGGMGVVYRGHDATLHRNVALKILQTRILQDEALTERFHREARLWARLSTPASSRSTLRASRMDFRSWRCVSSTVAPSRLG